MPSFSIVFLIFVSIFLRVVPLFFGVFGIVGSHSVNKFWTWKQFHDQHSFRGQSSDGLRGPSLLRHESMLFHVGANVKEVFGLVGVIQLRGVLVLEGLEGDHLFRGKPLAHGSNRVNVLFEENLRFRVLDLDGHLLSGAAECRPVNLSDTGAPEWLFVKTRKGLVELLGGLLLNSFLDHLQWSWRNL